MTRTDNTLGLYFHIPFCRSKCPYCDFYSVAAPDLFVPYREALSDELRTRARTGLFLPENITEREVDTVYFGGGTPSVFGGENIARVLDCVRREFSVTENAEITVECNPSTPELSRFFGVCRESGVNRISLGMQSAVDCERRALGRTADAEQVKNAIRYAKENGFDNISLDLMLGIPMQTPESLTESLRFVTESDVRHCSVYLLSIEPDTYFGRHRDRLRLPDDDRCADLYLQTVQTLEKHGLKQYEISNFAVPGCESRHNTKYWTGQDYLGIGAAAHSMVNGKRFFFPRDIKAFIRADEAFSDGEGGTPDEYIMLGLRLKRGISRREYTERFGEDFPLYIDEKAERFVRMGLMTADGDRLALTAEGMLVSNSILAELV